MWLITEAVDGTSAVAERWRSRPGTAVDAIAHGLRHLHDTLPVAGCPFDWSVGRRLREKKARGRTSSGSRHRSTGWSSVTVTRAPRTR